MLKLQLMSMVLPQESILGTELRDANLPATQKVFFSLAGCGTVSCGWLSYFWDGFWANAFWVNALPDLLMSSEMLLVRSEMALILFSSAVVKSH